MVNVFKNLILSQCVLYIAVVTVSFFVFGGDGSNVGLAITQALAMTGMVQWGMRQVSKTN